jgi:ABC-type uncharacterized transport system involved in gliding motility auxiliary subunit
MEINRKLRFRLRLQNGLFLALFLVAIGFSVYLLRTYHVQWDITQGARHSLSQASLNTLRQLPGPVVLTAYATQQDPKLGDIRKLIREFAAPYQRAKPDLSLKFIDPAEQPEATRAAGVKVNGEMVATYRNRSEHLTTLNEQTLTNALMRLARSEERLAMYLDGHGERKLDGDANHDLGDFGRHLQTKGFKIGSLNLALAQEVPANASLLLIASPQVDLLPGEVEKLGQYLARGGNLLWLIDQEPLHGLQSLAEALGLMLSPGVVIDPAAGQKAGVPATIALAALYARHPVTDNFDLITAFPFARQIGFADETGWHATNLIEVAPRGWVETGKLEGNPVFDKGRDIPGPVTVGITLERSVEDKNQRVAVIGSGAFLSNTYLGNGGNLDLGVNLVNWLAGDDNLITVQPRSTRDADLALSKPAAAVISIGFLLALPLAFLIAAIAIWRRRRK